MKCAFSPIGDKSGSRACCTLQSFPQMDVFAMTLREAKAPSRLRTSEGFVGTLHSFDSQVNCHEPEYGIAKAEQRLHGVVSGGPSTVHLSAFHFRT